MVFHQINYKKLMYILILYYNLNDIIILVNFIKKYNFNLKLYIKIKFKNCFQKYMLTIIEC